MKQSFLVILVALLVIACGSALYIPQAGKGLSAGDLAEMKKGRTAYIGKCGSCHALYLPEKYSAQEWKAQVGRMAARARLTAEEEQAMVKYLSKNDSTGSFSKPGSAVKK